MVIKGYRWIEMRKPIFLIELPDNEPMIVPFFLDFASKFREYDVKYGVKLLWWFIYSFKLGSLFEST